MNDQQLLEKAAKAAGMQHMRWAGPLGMVRMLDPSRPESTGSIGDYWNPLEDDGDALRLAAALHIDVEYYQGYGEVWAHPYDSDTSGVAVVEFTNDRAADTRRAIVRAAAAMGDAQ